MNEILKETLNSDGLPLLVYKNFTYLKSRCVGGDNFWRCVNRKCRSYMTTEGQPGKRFIVDSDLNHNHDPNEDKIKPLPTPSKRKHDEGEAEPRKILASRIEPAFCPGAVSKEKRGILRSLSFARKKTESSDSSSITSSDDGSHIELLAPPTSDPPFPETYLVPSSSIDLNASNRPTANPEEGARRFGNNKFRDEFEVAGWMYGNQLRSLDPQQRFIAEKLVADIVFRGRLKMLKVTSRVE